MKNLAKFAHFEKFIFNQKMINTKHVMYWSNYMYFNNKLQKISFKNSFIWKNEKDYNNIHNLFIK
jgi:hypothetical protein